MDFIRIEPRVRGLSELFRAHRRNLSVETKRRKITLMELATNTRITHEVTTRRNAVKLDRPLIDVIDLELLRHYFFSTIVIAQQNNFVRS